MYKKIVLILDAYYNLSSSMGENPNGKMCHAFRPTQWTFKVPCSDVISDQTAKSRRRNR